MVWAALITVYILWGSTYLGIRIAVQTMPPLLFAGVRFLIAGALLCAWRLPIAIREGTLPTADHWRRTLVIGAALLLGGNGGIAFAETTVPSGLTALLVSVVPLWMALIDRIFYGRKMSAAMLAGLVVGFGGVALLIGSPTQGPVSIVGAIIVVVASLSWAAGSLYSRGAKLPRDSFLTTGMEMLLGGLCLTVAAFFAGEFARVDVAAISTASWIALAYLIFFGGIVGFSAYLWVIRNAPTALVSTYAYVNPVVAVILGWAVLHETLTLRAAAAGAIIVASVAWIVSSRE
jgi:drug/metabolite transporter (DMT)-like permease